LENQLYHLHVLIFATIFHCLNLQIQDAQAALRLYTMFHQQWEADLVSRRSERKSKIIKGKKSTKETLKTKETVQSKESIKK
jgi:hypothetical protein